MTKSVRLNLWRRSGVHHLCPSLAIGVGIIALSLATPSLGQMRYELKAGQWDRQTDYDPSTPEGKLHTIRETLAADNSETALELAQQWIEAYPNHPKLDEARLLHGDAQVANADYYKSLFDYEYVIRQYPDSPLYKMALEREFRVAKLFTSGVKRRFLGMRILSAAGEAEEVFIRIQERVPGSELGELASLALADFYYDQAQMTSAAEAYDLFLTNYPESQYTERAILRQVFASLATFKGPTFDPTGLIEASQRIKTFRRQFPAAAERVGTQALLVRIEQSLGIKMLFIGQWYEKRGNRASSVYLYRRVVRDFPRTAAAQSAIKRLAELGFAVIPEAAGRDGAAAKNEPTDQKAGR